MATINIRKDIAMGRKSTVYANLPKGMRLRKRGNNIYYYYDLGGRPRKEIPLGKDYVLAVQQWSKLEMEKIPTPARVTFLMVATRYELEVIPKKSIRGPKDNPSQLKRLLQFFGGDNPAPLDEILPEHIKQLMVTT